MYPHRQCLFLRQGDPGSKMVMWPLKITSLSPGTGFKMSAGHCDPSHGWQSLRDGLTVGKSQGSHSPGAWEVSFKQGVFCSWESCGPTGVGSTKTNMDCPCPGLPSPLLRGPRSQCLNTVFTPSPSVCHQSSPVSVCPLEIVTPLVVCPPWSVKTGVLQEPQRPQCLVHPFLPSLQH
jgi:hypothetical protein